MERSHRKKEEMYPLVEAYHNRTVTQAIFCEEHKIKLSTLAYWISRYSKEQSGKNPRSIFRKVAFSDAPSDDSVSIQLPSGIRVTVSASSLCESTAVFIHSLAQL